MPKDNVINLKDIKKRPRPRGGMRDRGLPTTTDTRTEGGNPGEPTSTARMEQYEWKGIKPVAFARPRFNSKTRAVFNPTSYDSYKKSLQARILPVDRPPIPDPCEVTLIFGMGPPPKRPVWRFTAGIRGELQNTSKPDLDNLVKAILDAMNGIVWVDDAQVFSMTACKNYSEEYLIRMAVSWFEQPQAKR